MKTILLGLGASLMLMAGSCLATQHYEYKYGEILDVYISGNEQNRIEFARQNITEVIGDEGKYQLVSDKQGGNIFIRPQIAAGNSFTISLITDSGLVQDLRITAANIAGRTIIIEQIDKGTDGYRNDQEIANMLRAMNRGTIGKYYVSKTNSKIPALLPELAGCELIRQTTYRYGDLTGVILLIRNKSRQLLTLQEDLVSQIFTGTVAVSVRKQLLPARAASQVYIVTREEEDV